MAKSTIEVMARDGSSERLVGGRADGSPVWAAASGRTVWPEGPASKEGAGVDTIFLIIEFPGIKLPAVGG
ncbi:hypothetical protein GCM10009628_14010 [Paeniglutamicibacter kerguelensis]